MLDVVLKGVQRRSRYITIQTNSLSIYGRCDGGDHHATDDGAEDDYLECCCPRTIRLDAINSVAV